MGAGFPSYTRQRCLDYLADAEGTGQGLAGGMALEKNAPGAMAWLSVAGRGRRCGGLVVGLALISGLEMLRTQTDRHLCALAQMATRGQAPLSCLDLVALLHKQLADNPMAFATAKAPVTYPTMVGAAAA